MNGNNVALDTSAAVKLLNDIALATQFLNRVGKVYISAIAVGELLYGAMNSSRYRINLPRYQQFIDDCEIIPIKRATADCYAAIRLDLRKRGLPIPDADIWIAAAAVENSLPLAATDRHFSSVGNLTLFPLHDSTPS